MTLTLSPELEAKRKKQQSMQRVQPPPPDIQPAEKPALSPELQAKISTKTRQESSSVEPEGRTNESFPEQAAFGIAQGLLRTGTLPALATYIPEKAAELAFGNEQGLSQGQEQRLTQEHEITGRLNRGEPVSYADILALSDDLDIAPEIPSTTAINALTRLQQRIPKGGIVQEGIARTAEALPWIAGGASATPFLLSGYSGLAARETAAALGAGEVGQTIADIGGSLGYGIGSSFIKKSPEIAAAAGGTLKENFINTVQKEVDAGKAAIGQEKATKIGELSKIIDEAAPIRPGNPAQFNSRDVLNDLIDSTHGTQLDTIAPFIPSEQVWSNVQNATKQQFQRGDQLVSQLYNQANNQAQQVSTPAVSTVTALIQALRQATNQNFRIANADEYTTAIRRALNDLGVFQGLNGWQRAGDNPSVRDLMQVAKNLAYHADFSQGFTGLRGRLNGIVSTAKDEVRQNLNDSGLGTAFYDAAEEGYARLRDLFGNPPMRSAMNTRTPSNLSTSFNKPENLRNLRNALPEDVFRQVERDLVQRTTRGSTEAATKKFNPLVGILSEEAETAGRNIISMGDKFTSQGNRIALQEKILQEIQEGISTGKEPTTALTAMNNREGYELVRQTLSGTPNGDNILSSLENNWLKNSTKSFVKQDGKIVASEINAFLANRDTRHIAEQIGGKPYIEFLKKVSNISKNEQKINFIQKAYNNLGDAEKLLLGAGIKETFGAFGIPMAILLKVYTSPGGSKAINSMLSLKPTPENIQRAQHILRSIIQ